MNDNDIIKALECCKDRRCGMCDRRYGYHAEENVCRLELMENALDLINRQKVEIEELNAECEKQYEQAKADILGNISDGGTSCHWCMEQHEAKAIKEFAERLKSRVMKYTEWDEGGWDSKKEAVRIEDVTNILREMTEE